jgi:hypothetical protein
MPINFKNMMFKISIKMSYINRKPSKEVLEIDLNKRIRSTLPFMMNMRGIMRKKDCSILNRCENIRNKMI